MLLQKICRKFRGLFHDREIYDRGINLLGEELLSRSFIMNTAYSIVIRNIVRRERERETRANIKRFESVFEKESFSRLWRT